jgi:hypothetical protein
MASISWLLGHLEVFTCASTMSREEMATKSHSPLLAALRMHLYPERSNSAIERCSLRLPLAARFTELIPEVEQARGGSTRARKRGVVQPAAQWLARYLIGRALVWAPG